MAYSIDVVRRARERLAQAKEDRESIHRLRLAQAYGQVPRLREIDLQLRRTMAKAAQAAFLQGGDGRAQLEAIREENLALQRERAELLAASFEEGYLEEAPICTHCGGSGYFGSNMCACLQELCRQEQLKELTILAGPERFSQFRLDYYSDAFDPKYGTSPRQLMERNYQIVHRYASQFTPDSGNLLFVGGTGLGKTFLSTCVARAVADRGYGVVYETATKLFAKLEQARFNATDEARAEAEKFSDCDLLLIDDLGTELPGAFVTAALHGLLADRLLEQKPMVISTNLNVDELARRYSPQIASRLHGSFQRLTFLGEDIRVLRNRGTK